MDGFTPLATILAYYFVFSLVLKMKSAETENTGPELSPMRINSIHLNRCENDVSIKTGENFDITIQCKRLYEMGLLKLEHKWTVQ